MFKLRYWKRGLGKKTRLSCRTKEFSSIVELFAYMQKKKISGLTHKLKIFYNDRILGEEL